MYKIFFILCTIFTSILGAFISTSNYTTYDIERGAKREMRHRFKTVEKVLEEIVPELEKNGTCEEGYAILARLVAVEEPFLRYVKQIIEENKYYGFNAETKVPLMLNRIASLEKYERREMKKRICRMLTVAFGINDLHEGWDFELTLHINEDLHIRYFKKLVMLNDKCCDAYKEHASIEAYTE
uniref:Uncharacterized protein n=1 Tax=Clastoptera arizonana TaxID=38151 RepID=A0A1B6D3A4_9HEMI